MTLEREVLLPGVKGRIDHLTLDPAHHRLFVAEIANGTVDAIDLVSGKMQRISGLAEPQGVAYLPAQNQLVVASGGDGTVRFYNAATLAPLGQIKLGDDADNVRVDKPSGQIAVGYGSGAIALIDPARREVIGRIDLPAHPEGFQIDDGSARLYVNLPNAGTVAVADLHSAKVTARWVAPHRLNFPMALGAEGKQIAIVSRLPAHVTWFDAASGAVRLDLPTCGDADDIFRDAKRHRWYVSCGSGKVEIFAEQGSAITAMGTVQTGTGGRTSLFSPELDRLIVAVPAGWTGSAKLLLLKPNE
ncbi:YncE family protein [Novosphingobium umbonatum]|uniref:YncE family protein n=1 Tax=Novosphingobium umbonatum TaxID=1908524 RepID=UPI001FE5E18A|nr:hypothetical protein [Novosphingobium umbonatum]